MPPSRFQTRLPPETVSRSYPLVTNESWEREHSQPRYASLWLEGDGTVWTIDRHHTPPSLDDHGLENFGLRNVSQTRPMVCHAAGNPRPTPEGRITPWTGITVSFHQISSTARSTYATSPKRSISIVSSQNYEFHDHENAFSPKSDSALAVISMRGRRLFRIVSSRLHITPVLYHFVSEDRCNY